MTHDFDEEMRRMMTAPYDAARVEAFADLARRADAAGDAEDAFHARLGLLDAGMIANRLEVALAVFPRLLADVDASPGRFAAEECVLLAFPMLLSVAASFPGIPRSRLDALGEDFARRAAAAGTPDSEIAGGLYRLATAVGDLPRARDLLARMGRPWGGHFAECEHCRTRHRMMLPWCEDDRAEVLRLATRVIDGGLACTRYEFCGPREALLLRPLALAGDAAGAVRRYRVAAAGLRSGDPFWVAMPALHLSFLSWVVRRGGAPGMDRDDAAGRLRDLLTRCAARSAGISPAKRLDLLSAAGPAVGALADAGADAVAFPPGAGFNMKTADPAAAAAAMTAEAEALAAAFDARNGNEFHLRHHERQTAFALGH